MARGGRAALIAVAACLAVPVLAAKPSPRPQPGQVCEAHIWPATYLPHPGYVPKSNAFVRAIPPSDNPASLSQILNAQARLADMDDAALRVALGLAADAPVIRHADFIDVNMAKKAVVRLAPGGTGDCYIDLVLSDMTYFPARTQTNNMDYVGGVFTYRRFGAGNTLAYKFKSGFGGNIAVNNDDYGLNPEAAQAAIHAVGPMMLGQLAHRLDLKQGVPPAR